jgi:hypothetical protein
MAHVAYLFLTRQKDQIELHVRTVDWVDHCPLPMGAPALMNKKGENRISHLNMFSMKNDTKKTIMTYLFTII